MSVAGLNSSALETRLKPWEAPTRLLFATSVVSRLRSGPARSGASPRPRLACFGERLAGSLSFVNVSVAGLNSSALEESAVGGASREAARDQDLPGGQRRRDRVVRASVSDCPASVSFVNVSVAGLNSSALDRAWTSQRRVEPPAIRTCPFGSVAATAPERASVSDWPGPVSFVNVSVAGLNSSALDRRCRWSRPRSGPARSGASPRRRVRGLR